MKGKKDGDFTLLIRAWTRGEINTGCLAVVTFFGASNSDETEQGMKLLWDIINPEPDLLDNNDKVVCTAACEALALIFETKRLEKFSTETKDSYREGYYSFFPTSSSHAPGWLTATAQERETDCFASADEFR
ncbi:hypothetical protein V6N13_114965 [Hibiscus sabdariffa]